MGYACPVCDDPQADGEHLAHHLAFVALLHGDGSGGDDHEAWLDAHVPDWSERNPAALASAVTGPADEIEVEGTVDGAAVESGPVGHQHPDRDAMADLDPETRRILEEARKMTRRKLSGVDGEE